MKRTIRGSYTVRWKAEDGKPGEDAVYYEMKVMKGGSVITSIPCDSTGKPKKVENVSAYIYRVVGRNKTLISDFYFRVDGLSDAGAVSEVLVSQASGASSCSFSCATLATRSYRIRATEGSGGTGNVVAEVVIPKNLDGVAGGSGYTYRPRGVFASGNSYVYNDEYRDVIMKEFSNKVYMFRVRTKGTTATVAPASASGDANWEVANDLGFVATDLFLAAYALIKNLGVETIDMKDSSGNVLFQAKDGNVICKTGTFENITVNKAKITGSLRNPFAYVGDSITSDYNDNVVMISNGGGWIDAYSLPWDVSQCGRRVCIVNYRWKGSYASGSGSISAPSGKYFYENGISKDSLNFSREVIELMGYGDSTTFYGWIVLRRNDIMTTARYGKELKVLAQGIVTGINGRASISAKTFDGTDLSVSRSGEGIYTVTIPSTWGLVSGSYLVMLTGYGNIYNTDFPIKATLASTAATSFVVHTSDDDSRNDGSFMFQITNLNDWMYLT